MIHFRHEIRIEAPVEGVWAVLCDASRWKEWAPRSEFSDFSGPVDEVGTTYSDTTRLFGIPFRMVTEVVEVEPLRLYHEHTDTGPVDTVIHLQPDGDTTRLVLESDADVAGILGKLPSFLKYPIARRVGEWNWRQYMAGLKALSESNVPT